MKNIIQRTFIIVIYLHLITLTYGQSKSWKSLYSIDYINSKTGLPNDYIDYIFKDSRGFIWFATNGNGIVRYDSYRFKSINLQTSNNTFRNNYAKKICEDRFNRLWIIGQDGIDLIENQSLKSINPENNSKSSFVLKNIIANDILCSKNGNIWISTNKKLIKVEFNNSNGAINNVSEILKYDSPCPNVSLCEENGFIYFNQNNGLYKIKDNGINSDNKERTRLVLKDIQDVNVIKSFEKELWICTNKGLYIFNEKENKLKKLINNPTNPNSLSQSQITDIDFIDQNTIIISTLKGLNLYHRDTEYIERIQEEDNESDENHGLNCNFINCLLYDKGTIWIGTEAGGINKLTKKRLQVKNLLYNKTSYSNVINCIAEDSLHRLWVGAVEGGLYMFENTNTPPIHYTNSSPAYLPHLSISCFTFESTHKLWIGTWGGGLGWINTGNSKSPLFQKLKTTSDEYDIRHIRGLCFDKKNGLLWIGEEKNIYAYNPSEGNITAPLKQNGLGGIKAENAGCIIDKNNYLWLGLSKGLCRINLNTYNKNNIDYALWPFKLDNPASGIKEHVSYIFESRNGSIWIGSNGFGIYQVINPTEDSITFKNFDSSDGLVNNCVRGITEDINGNLWITTTQGISCFNPQTHTFSNYIQEDGLLCNQFYWNSICNGKKGEIYAGTMSGLSIIYPTMHAVNTSEVPMVITDLQIANHNVPASDQKIIMNESDKTITIEFAALNYILPSQIFYAYRIKELNENWHEVTADNRKVTFTNLKAGTYTFEAIYSTDHKNWISKPLTVSFQVVPPFYKKGWFILCMIILLITILFANHFQRIRRLKIQRNKLESEVKLRTQELTYRNEQLSSQNAIINKQKEEIINASRRIQELTSDQLSFFTNIAHEFRTPLTLIIGPTERALMLSDNENVNRQLQYVSRNSQYLLSLVNQLLDFRKMEAGKIEANYKPCNISTFINNTIYPLTAYASDKNLTLSIYTHFSSENIMMDENALQKIITNIVSNALKFTPTEGHIKIYAALITVSGTEEKRLFISVSDNGIGIKPEHIKYIFDLFYQSKQHDNQSFHMSGGTGIGLYFCKQLTKMLNGQITVKNNKNKGCTFRVLLPVEIYTHMEKQSIIAENNITKEQEYKETSIHNKQNNILIVEDNLDMRSYIKSILQPEFHIYEAANGKEALCKIKEKHIDMIISDIMMPVMDGITLSQNVKSNLSTSHIPFIILTAKTSEENKINSFEIGVDDYLTKPFNEKILLARVKNILENRQKAQMNFANNMDTNVLLINESSKDSSFIEEVMSFIKTHYTDPNFEINDIINHIGISRSLFYQKLQDLTGESAGHIIRNYRLNTARELLIKQNSNKETNISEIAYQVGFNDPKYFSRCFSKRFNISPSAFIKQSHTDKK